MVVFVHHGKPCKRIIMLIVFIGYIEIMRSAVHISKVGILVKAFIVGEFNVIYVGFVDNHVLSVINQIVVGSKVAFFGEDGV